MENTDNTNDINKTDGPVINNYQNQAEKRTEETLPLENKIPTVNPSAEAPAMRIVEEKPELKNNPENAIFKKDKKPVNPVTRRKAILGCFGGFFVMIAIFVTLAFVFISQASSGKESSVAKLLGINQASFVNGLITLTNIAFILVLILIFTITMMGLIKVIKAKKDDKETKKKGIKMSIISGAILMLFFIIWLVIFAYLDGKRINVQTEILDPIITIPAETLNLTAPVTIKFDASNVPVDSKKYQIISYVWDFGDGQTGTGQVVSHQYAEKGKTGRYDVILTVTKKDKNTGEEIEAMHTEVIIIGNQALTATFKADPMTGEVPLEVSFDASGSFDPDGNIDAFEWDFDEDGEFDDAIGVNADYKFEKIGEYTVALKVTTKAGEYQVAEGVINVVESQIPEPVITSSNTESRYTVDRQYIFKSDESISPNGKIEEFEWDFGDGSPLQKTKTASYSFDKEGTYEITLTIIDEKGKEGTLTQTITVGAVQGKPNAVITTTPVLADKSTILKGVVPFKVEFSAASSTDSDNNIVEYEWDFDDDGIVDGFGERTTHTFDKVGMYTVNLTITDSDSNIGTAKTYIDVQAQGIISNLTADKIEGNVPLTVAFDASGSTYSGGQITSYRWDFGDGTKPKLGSAKISHKYDTVGSYKVVLEVIGSDNSKATQEIQITVREIPLFACFKSVFNEGPAPLETIFDPGCSTGTVASYFWDFGDGNTSTSVKPSHTYTSAGSYNVILEVSDADNTVDTTDLTVTVT